ncbi:DUF4381 domain-containing protein [Marinobacterium maritimum]|uniref:DUF4381 domain-containing protein n=1 Tax=Marinobacterium maritimum TaxID=500162 RepID=A0ABP3TAA3_9GAMM
MSLISELNQLQELPAPPMPDLWPQTWGWWALLFCLLTLALIVFVTWRRRRHANAYRRVALLELDRLQRRWQQLPNDPSPLRDIPDLLKQAVIARLGQENPDIAVMTGHNWQKLLSGMARTPLPQDFAHHLELLAYADDQTLQALNLASLIADCRHWLENHHDPV